VTAAIPQFTANGKMRACGDAGLQFRVSRFRYNNRVGVRVSDGVRVSTFYYLSHWQPAEARRPAFYP